ncbi:MAG: HlyD family secretion protein [Opitutales bacterium]
MAAAEVNTAPSEATRAAPVAPPAMPAARPPGWGRKLGKFAVLVFRIALTCEVTAAALWLAFKMWQEYQVYPWTRDGQVQADIVGIAARVSGPMIKVSVKDNEYVHKGDMLFEIDPSTFAAMVASDDAQLALAHTKTIESQREALRRKALVEQQFVSIEDYQQANAAYKEDAAAETAAQAQLDLDRLNLSYTKVVSPVNGYVTNMHLAVGTYVTAGTPLMALVDTDSFYVYGYFPETEIGNIQVGDSAVVQLLGYNGQKMDGVVHSIGWAIYREDGSPTDLLPNISPTIDWVLLAQRFPVRVKLNYQPHGLPLRVGQTVSVVILKKGDTGQFVPWWVW